EIKLPELPSPQLPAGAQTGASDADAKRRVAPIQWLKSGELLLENELQNHVWGRVGLEITLGFDQDNQASIRKSEQEKMSIVDYFLLLPDDYFERPPSTWLHAMRYYNYAI